MALPAGDAERPAGEVPQDHPDHCHEALSRARRVPGPPVSRGYATLPGVPMDRGRRQDHLGGCRTRRDCRAGHGCVRAARRAAAAARPRADIVLPVETQTIEAIVPRQATLETILRQHELPAPARPGGDRVDARRVQPASPSRRTAVPPRAVGRRIPEGVRVPDRRRPFPAHRQPRPVDAREARRRGPVSTTRRRSVVAIRGRIDGEHSSLIAAVDATGERVQLAIAIAELFSGQIDFENDLQPGDSFEVLFETTKYEGAVRRLRRDPRRAVHQRTARSTRPIAGCTRGRRRPATTTSRDARCGGSCSRRRCGSRRA